MKWIAGLLCLAVCAWSLIASAQTTAPKTYKLTMVSGTFRDNTNKEVTGSGDFPAGARIWITADDAAPGKAFDQWSADAGDMSKKGLGGNSVKDVRTILTMPAQDLTLTATYKDFKAIRVACIGETSTDMTNYPKELGKYLNSARNAGDKDAEAYDVRNYAVADSTIVLADYPWVKTNKCARAKAFLPNVVIILMGVQDTQKGKNFDHHDTFVAEYENLVKMFADLPTHPKVYVCLPPPVYGNGNWGMTNEALVSTIIPGIKKVAEDLKLPLIDLNTPMTNRPDLVRDNVHLVGEANVILAGEVYKALTGKEPPVSAGAPKTPAAAKVPTTQGAYTGKPYGGTAREIPGVIQAEHYDVAPDGAEGITFHYKGGGKKTEFRTTNDAIGLAKFGGGHMNTKGEAEDANQVYLGWTQSGQWMKYTVHVKDAGTYRFGGKFAVAGKDAKLSVVFTPIGAVASISTGALSIPTTAGFQPNVEVYHVWEKVDNLAEVTLPAGDYVMTVTLDNAGGTNMDYFSVTAKP